MPRYGVLLDNNYTLTGWKPAADVPVVASMLGIDAKRYLAAAQAIDLNFDDGPQVGLSRIGRMKRILKKLQLPQSNDVVVRLVEAEQNELYERTFLFPGVLEVVRQLQASDYQLVLCSNDSYYGLAIARRRGLLELLKQSYVFSCDHHVRKESGELYKIAAAKIKCKLEDCVVVDDGGDQSLVAARALGLKTIRVEHSDVLVDPASDDMVADRVVYSLWELPEALQSLLNG